MKAHSIAYLDTENVEKIRQKIEKCGKRENNREKKKKGEKERKKKKLVYFICTNTTKWSFAMKDRKVLCPAHFLDRG